MVPGPLRWPVHAVAIDSSGHPKRDLPTAAQSGRTLAEGARVGQHIRKEES
jgi:hypothetical protein